VKGNANETRQPSAAINRRRQCVPIPLGQQFHRRADVGAVGECARDTPAVSRLHATGVASRALELSPHGFDAEADAGKHQGSGAAVRYVCYEIIIIVTRQDGLRCRERQSNYHERPEQFFLPRFHAVNWVEGFYFLALLKSVQRISMSHSAKNSFKQRCGVTRCESVPVTENLSCVPDSAVSPYLRKVLASPTKKRWLER
jgi:hypothetical protein